MKLIQSGAAARETLLQSIAELYKPVASTMGPKGKTVIISNVHDAGRYTKDGVSVAREISHENQLINAGIKIFREAANKTVKDAGDGTTTSTVLLYHLINEVHKRMQSGANIVDIKNALSIELDICVNAIKEMAVPLVVDGQPDIPKILQLALTSANGDQFVAEKIAEAYEKVGPGVAIEVRETQKPSYLETVSGMRLENGMASPYFSNIEDKVMCMHKNPLVFVTDKALLKNTDILRFIDYSHGKGLPLVIFCTDIAGEALGMLNQNVAESGLQVCAVALPLGIRTTRDTLKDIAAFTGAKFCSHELGYNLDNISDDEIPSYLGSMQMFQAAAEYSILAGGRGTKEAIQARINEINEKITPDVSDWMREELLSRKSKLSGGFALLYIGGKTAGEIKELKDRCEDAVLAVRSAIEAGYLPGCGKAYLMASKKLPGKSILIEALHSITRQVCFNGDINEIQTGEIILKMLSSGVTFGYNARTDTMEDLFKAGVIDSAKVVISALQNAVSAALAFVNTEFIIAQEKKD